MIDYIKECGKTELFEPKFFTSLTAALYVFNFNSACETSKEQDQVIFLLISPEGLFREDRFS